MNNGKLLLATAVIIGSALISVPVLKSKFTSAYKPIAEVASLNEKNQDASGAQAWWTKMQKNESGVVDYTQISLVREQVMMQARQKSMNAWPLTFSEIGPDNVGGRTRAICIDRLNTQHIFAGGISGGLFESFDGGANWTHKLASDQYDVLTISSIIQAADNTSWYFGTGEGVFYPFYGSGTGGFIGGGVWKSTDNGSTFARLTSTTPTSPSTPSYPWAAVSKMGCDPVNPNQIYAGTINGLYISTNGGTTWTLGQSSLSGTIYDVDVASNGTLWVVSGSRLWKSTTGAVGSFTVISSPGYPVSGMGRTEIAIAPSDPNYMYAVMDGASTGALFGAYCSIDGGANWTQIAGVSNQVFAPFGSSNQGAYDMTLAVDPFDKERLIFGGVQLWKWELNHYSPIYGQWTEIAYEFPDDPSNTFYVHSDKHIIVFDPIHQNKFFIGCDGGVFRTLDCGQSYIPMNKAYRVTQCYGVASDYYAPTRNVAFAGCQDNGTQFVNGLGNTAMSAVSIGGGDGGQVEMSFLNPNAMFETIYYGTLSRSANRGSAFSDFYNTRISSNTNLGMGGFANFVTPIRLWESLNDQYSTDSTRFVATRQVHNLVQGNGIASHFADTLKPAYNGIPEVNASIIPGSLVVTAGSVSMTDNGAGVLSGTGGTGTIVYATKIATLNFTIPPPVGSLVQLTYDVTYNSGVQLLVQSHTNNLRFNTVCPHTLSSLGPNDTTYVKDIIQSKLAVGFAASNGVYVTLAPLDFSTTPTWVKVASPNSIPDAFSGGATVQCSQWSPDGRTFYFATDQGQVYRLDSMNTITNDTILSDVDVHVGSSDVLNPRCKLQCHRIGNFGIPINAIDIDPSNPDRLLLGVCGYTGGSHIYLCTNATTAPSDLSGNGNFSSVQGSGLISMPVYACSFDKYNPGYAMIGTDYGIFSTSSVGPGCTWVKQSGNFANVPTLQIRQSRWDPWNGCMNAGVFYIATHGRGMWKSEVSYVPTGIQEHPGINRTSSAPSILIYPNPMSDNARVNFHLNQTGVVHLRIFTLKGEFVKEILLPAMPEGDNTAEFSSSDLSSGTYLMSFESGLQKGVSRFIVLK
jgi:hypothetical protein